MKITKLTGLPGIMIFLLIASWGCIQTIEDQEKYQRPDWLEGFIFEQIEKDDSLSTFIACLERTGYDTLLNTSGSYTVFAPHNDAFDEYFEEHPQYNSVGDMPYEDVIGLVEYQLIYNAWSRKQFQSLDVFGWIDPESETYNKPRGYKRQTVYHEDNKTYSVVRRFGYYEIVEPGEAEREVIVYNESPKYAPIFYNDYLNLYQLTGNDYTFYFEREDGFDKNTIYFAGAALGKQIFAENGFIYKTDKVVSPLPNAEQILERGGANHSYQEFLDLIYEFSEVNANFQATYDQPEAEAGVALDTLYDVRYPELSFNIHNELTAPSGSHYTIREHPGFLAPTDNAFQTFINDYIAGGWGRLSDMPKIIKSVILNTHMTENAIYQTDIGRGFVNAEEDSVMLDEGTIIQKTYGSNCSFLGLDEVVIPRAFISVARPIYLERGYETMLYAVEDSKVLSALKKPNANYAFFLPEDGDIGTGGDSSLVREITDRELNRYRFRTFDMSAERWENLSINELRKRLLNQIAVHPPRGIARYEFLENLGGNYIIYNNDNNIVRGTSKSVFGFRGDSAINITADPYNVETDNGKVYRVNALFSYTSRTLWIFLSSGHRTFMNLMEKAGLYDDTHVTFPFMLESENHTVFLPADTVLEKSGLDTLPVDQLREILEYHFIRGDLVFTDGNKPSGKYRTKNVNQEQSTPLQTVYNKINLRNQPDLIQVLDKDGEVYVEIPYHPTQSNQVITYDSDPNTASSYDYITSGAVHIIDKILYKDSLIQVN